jgi:outer membrane protein OmpA-like peptidoglycan-associated protein/tetratricopeptide (TPR) repeat protein
MKKLLLLLFFGFLLVKLPAQSTNISTVFLSTLEKADLFYERFAYRNALPLYMHVVEKDPLHVHARTRIASCYWQLGDTRAAELWLSSLAKEPDSAPEIKYQLAEALCMNQKYADARYWFESYLKAKPNDRRAIEKITFLKNISRYVGDSLRFVVGSVAFNSPYSDFGAAYYRNGLVFTSSRDAEFMIRRQATNALQDDESLLNLYFVTREVTGDYGAVTLFRKSELKSYFHDGPAVFYDHDRRIAFTQSNAPANKPKIDALGKINLRIMLADMAHFEGIKNLQEFPFNSEGYSNAHPSVNANGSVMFFASTMPKGYGGSDIYYSIHEHGRWQEPVNAGPEINTPGDELYPYLCNDTTLFFSSDGHGSLGGLDILVSYRKRNGAFRKPYNFGATLNSPADDFGIVADSTGRIGYFASNREGGMGQDDVYFFIANSYFLAGEVRELSREQKRLPGTTIIAFNSNGDVVDSVTSDDDGNFSLSLPFDQNFKIRGEKDGYETLEDLVFSTRGKFFGVDSLLLPMWKYKLFAKGRIFSNETQNLLPGATVLLHNITDNRTDTVVVDDNGEYNFLVRPNKRYEITASREGFISSGFKLNTQNIWEGELLNDIVLEEVYVEKDIIFFDYNSYRISQKSIDQMNRIVRTLKKYPDATVHVAAHADSRGTAQYNKKLSDSRARVAVDYFASRGISPRRIEWVGFGEELILNRCSDGVECQEEEHSKNRRAEIKVQRLVPVTQ